MSTITFYKAGWSDEVWFRVVKGSDRERRLSAPHASLILIAIRQVASLFGYREIRVNRPNSDPKNQNSETGSWFSSADGEQIETVNL